MKNDKKWNYIRTLKKNLHYAYRFYKAYKARYSRTEQVKFFKGCLPHILLGPFFNTLSHLSVAQSLISFMNNYSDVEFLTPFATTCQIVGAWEHIVSVSKYMERLHLLFRIDSFFRLSGFSTKSNRTFMMSIRR